jgi:hypothetical protein
LFSNEQIEIADLPRLENLNLTPVHPNYLYILLLNIGTAYGIGVVALIVSHILSKDENFKTISLYALIVLMIVMLLHALVYILGFKM